MSIENTSALFSSFQIKYRNSGCLLVYLLRERECTHAERGGRGEGERES